MQKIVINNCYGGFSLSVAALKEYTVAGGRGGTYDVARNDPILIEVVERLGAEANGMCARLKIVEIPDDIDWIIEEHDGNEWVSEVHRTWQ